jgi:hypothetical protein
LLSACATTPGAPGASNGAPASSGSLGQRELSPQEKKVIMDAVGPSLSNADAAKYHWARFPALPSESSVNYCATVDAKSPFPAYSGHQSYIVEAQLSGGRVPSAVMGLIAGGKDAALVSKMCAKYGLNPNDAI